MNKSEWLSSLKHVFKIDPNRPIAKDKLIALSQSETDAIIIGGTLGVTYEDTVELLKQIRKNSLVPVVQEISNLESIVPGFDYYLIPLVLNAQDPKWILNAHHQAIKKFGELINWDQVFIEGYVVLNAESSVAKLTKSKTNLELDDIESYGRMADQMLKLPITYIEYSGIYGDINVVSTVKDVIKDSKLFYGGGIKSLNEATEMANYADTVVIGNLIYEDFAKALETVTIKKNQLYPNH